MSSERPPVRAMVKNAVEELGGNVSKSEIVKWISAKYENVNPGTIRAQANACTVNQPSRIHLPECSKPRAFDSRYDFLFNTGEGKVELYDSNKHGNYELIESEGKTVVAKDGIPISNTHALEHQRQHSTLIELWDTNKFKQELRENLTTTSNNNKQAINNSNTSFSTSYNKGTNKDDVYHSPVQNKTDSFDYDKGFNIDEVYDTPDNSDTIVCKYCSYAMGKDSTLCGKCGRVV
jgi:hypothetical protein